MVMNMLNDEFAPIPPQKRKTNRDVLMRMDIYDILRKLQGNLENYGATDPCIMDALGVIGVRSRCEHYWPTCKNCIAAWLNEEEGT
jgi:hypothetical protein